MRKTTIVANAGAARRVRMVGRALILVATFALGGCYPRYDWRDVRPDCAKTWCGFVASFPGKVRGATREIPVGAVALPLSVNIVTVDDVSFAVNAFELRPGADVVAARALLERKLLADVGAPAARRGRAEAWAADRTRLDVDTVDADGTIEGRRLRAQARFVVRRDRLIEMLVVGPFDELDGPRGRQAAETFFTSLRLD